MLLLVVVKSNTDILLSLREIGCDDVQLTKCAKQVFCRTTIFVLDKKIVDDKSESNTITGMNKQARCINTLDVTVSG